MLFISKLGDYLKRKGFLLLVNKLIEKKKTNPSNSKEYYNSYLKRKNTKSVKG